MKNADLITPEVYKYVEKFLRQQTKNKLSKEGYEDLTQDVFVAIVESIEKFDPDNGSFTAWCCGVAKNVIRDYYEKRYAQKRNPQREVSFTLLQQPDDGELLPDVQELLENENHPPPEEELQELEHAALILKALKSIPKRQAYAIALSLDGWNDGEIARDMGITVKNVWHLRNRGMAKLKNNDLIRRIRNEQ